MIGIDVVDVNRLDHLLRRSRGLEVRLFTPGERRYCNARTDPVRHLAGTLAVKEAVIKAAGLGPLVAWSRRVEVERDRSGAPHARIHGVQHGALDVSISHDGPMAVAIAIHHGNGIAEVKPSTKNGDRPVINGSALRPNPQLQRYIGHGDRGHPRTEPTRTPLAEAAEFVQGSDFP